MIYTNRQRLKKIIRSVLVVILFLYLGFMAYGIIIHTVCGRKLHEKTTFTDREKEILWSELGLEYIDLDISKAYYSYYNRDHKRVVELIVVSEGFDSIDEEIEYLKQFKGNENVHQGQENYNIYGIAYNTDKNHSNRLIECTTYREEKGKYYLEFCKNESEHNGIDNVFDEVFGSDDAGEE